MMTAGQRVVSQQAQRVGRTCWVTWLIACVLATCGAVNGPKLAAQRAPARVGGARPLSNQARSDWALAEKLAAGVAGKVGAERACALELAAAAYDRCSQTAGSGVEAARAGWAAAELWRRHGSLLLAERGYLVAAREDRLRFGQRGLSAAADMQRRQGRSTAAMQTYAQAARVDPRTARAQRARVWIGKLWLARGATDRATAQLQAALECASTTRQVLDCANELANAWIATGDLDQAAAVLAHVDRVLRSVGDEDAQELARLRRASDAMSARRALQRAVDERDGRAADAVRLDEYRRRRRDIPAPSAAAC